jgi:hypothetical protein
MSMIVPGYILVAIKRLVDYSFEEEKKHYLATARPNRDHIFVSLRRIRKFLEREGDGTTNT